MFLTDILSWLGQWCTAVIAALGYPGIVILMAFESMILPFPSELIMPFAGFLAGQGRFSFALVIVFSALGSIIGSLISYALGRYLGRAAILKYGKFLLLHEADLVSAESWFAQRGSIAIFIARFIPVVRHVISIPAGTAKMPLWKFCLYTLVGATLWNAFLAYCGFVLGERWAEVRQYSEYLSIAVAILLVIAGIWFVWHHWKTRRSSP